MTAETDPARRFSGRAGDYTRHRPGYPAGVIDVLVRAHGLAPGWTVADVGSGTGKLSGLFLAFGCRVLGVEPNPDMRAEAESLFAAESRFVSVEGRAEESGLGDASVDLAVAGQAFHWFEPCAARAEFRRILRGNRTCALVWNTRITAGTGLAPAYEAFLRDYSRDYLQIEARQSASELALEQFFDRGQYVRDGLPNAQVLDREGLRGRYRSCSYALAPGDARFVEAMRVLDGLFEEHQRGGTVTMEYETVVCHGRVGG